MVRRTDVLRNIDGKQPRIPQARCPVPDRETSPSTGVTSEGVGRVDKVDDGYDTLTPGSSLPGAPGIALTGGTCPPPVGAEEQMTTATGCRVTPGD